MFDWLSRRGPRETTARAIDDSSRQYAGYYSLDSQLGDPLIFDGDEHSLIIGPTRSGKGTRLLVPNLLRLTDQSLIVIDPKGELAAITADYRAQSGKVFIINPFDVLGLGSCGFNPLAGVDPASKTFPDDVAGIADAMILPEPGTKNSHFSKSAVNFVAGFTQWEILCASREKRVPSMINVRRMMTEADDYRSDSTGKERLVGGFHHTLANMIADGGFEVESLVGRFMRDNDEIGGIQSTADNNTAWMLSRFMQEDLERPGLDFARLKDEPTTVYVILPAERMSTHSQWLRLVVVSALRALYKPGGLKTLMVLDEFPQLGRFAPIKDAFGLVGGFGVQVSLIVQDLNQLKDHYGDGWETFVGNAGVMQCLPPQDLFTAQYLSRYAGDTTIVSAGFTSGIGLGIRKGEGLSYQQGKRPLFLPQELMNMPPGSGLVWKKGATVPFYAPSYWDLPVIDGRAEPNPYYLGAS